MQEQIPYNNKVINIDEISCGLFENCEKCQGSVETLKCDKCKKGYLLINNICIIPQCILGENEKCLSCNINIGKEKECSECNEGYYLNTNIQDKSVCSKCLIEGCKKCDIYNNCFECKNNYKPIIDSISGEITFCNLLCDLGNYDKCSACDMINKKQFDCGSCNDGYKLINGKCKKIENSFIAIYEVASITDYTQIMTSWGDKLKFSDFLMYVNGIKVQPSEKINYIGFEKRIKYSYIFSKLGINEVKIIFKKTLTDMRYLFENCYDLISIEFSENFDTSHVLCMESMFSGCDRLQYVNFTSFNTTLVGNMNYMFYQCDSLISINLSNFITKNTATINRMFSFSDQLCYIDISLIDTTVYKMFEDIAQTGTIIINKNFRGIDEIPPGWKIIIKE